VSSTFAKPIGGNFVLPVLQHFFLLRRCYLLIQAFLTGAKLPISDYINDTRSVLDQLPRLLAAMENVALNQSAEYTFDLLCMFTIARQVINTRSLVSTINHMLSFCNISPVRSSFLPMPAWRECLFPFHRDVK